MAEKKNWSDLTGREKWRVFVLGTAQVALQFVALKDLAERPQSEVRGPKAAWVAGSFLNFVGPIAYLTVGRIKR